MSSRLRMFVGGFLIAVIVVGTMAGFTVVDLSTARYMPGRMGPMFAVTSIGGGGIDLSFMGRYYSFDGSALTEGIELAAQYQGLIPAPVRAAAALAEFFVGLINQM